MWQPIETAPKDGTDILLTGPAYDDFSKGRYVANGLFYDGDWRRDEESDKMFSPTHWMPLPEPPDA